MRKGRKYVVALAAALFVSAMPTTAFGDVILYSPSKTSTVDKGTEKTSELSEAFETVKTLIESGKMTMEEIREMGPGYAAALEEYSDQMADTLGIGLQEALEEEKNADFNGPTVTKVNLSQVYHEEYKTYELSMADQYFIYTNVANGGMTHEPVIIDIPANVTYTVEKDGLPYEYVSQQYISANGTYVMKLMGIENKDAPLSEQKEYQATFRFRITDEPPVEESEEAAENGSSVSGSGNPLWSDTPVSSDIPVLGVPETEPVIEIEPETIAPVDEKEPETEAEPETEPVITPGNQELMEREQAFELATGNYRITMENGMQLISSVPEGYIGSGTVTLSVSEGDAVVTKLYRNDEPVDFVNEGTVTELGRYRVDMDGCSYFFTLADKVSQMEYYPAPAGMEFTEVRFNNEVMTLASGQYAEMPEDGIYTFVMNGENGERYEVILEKDTVAPEMNVSVAKSTAAIQYLSDDIKTIELVKDGKLVSGFGGTSITDPGKYTLTIYDGAGNSTSASFQLKYQVNMYGILAVVLIILAVAGIGAFVVYTKKNTKVR